MKHSLTTTGTVIVSFSRVTAGALPRWAYCALTCLCCPLLAGGNEGDAATADGIAAYDTAGERDQLQHKGIGNDSSAAQAPAAKQQQKQSPFDAPSKAGHVALLMYDGSSSPAGPDAAGSSGSSTSSSSEGLEVTAGGNSGRAKREGASYPEQVQVLVTRAAKVRRWVALAAGMAAGARPHTAYVRVAACHCRSPCWCAHAWHALDSLSTVVLSILLPKHHQPVIKHCRRQLLHIRAHCCHYPFKYMAQLITPPPPPPPPAGLSP